MCQQKLDFHRFALGVDHLVVDDAPAGVLQQLVGAALLLANHAAGIGNTGLEHVREHLLGNLPAQGLQNGQLGFGRRCLGGHFRVLEVAASARIGAVEQLLVGPFKVEQQA